MRYIKLGVLAAFAAVFMGSCAPRVVERIVEVPAPQATNNSRRGADAMEGMSIADQVEAEERRQGAEKSEELKREGWKIDDPSRTLRMAILQHQKARKENPRLIEIVGNASNCKTLNVCQATARQNAQLNYVENISAKIEGGSVGHIFSKQTNDTPTDSEQTTDLFKRKFGEEIGRAMKISYGVYKEELDQDKGIRYQIVYLIDGKMAEQSAKKALKESIDEAKLATEYAKQITEGLNAINFEQTSSDTSR